jgi:RNA polymerase sigma-70 factor (ECF subfamily)
MADFGEKSLAGRVLKSDLDAYGALIQDNQTSVFNVCYRILGNRQEAEDLTQEAFIRAYQKLSRYDPSRPFGPWMRTLAANLCFNHIKKGQLDRVPLEDEKDQIKGKCSNNPENLLEMSQEHQVLYQALWKLPDNQRIALELRHFQGLSYQDMAEVLHLPLNTVRSHLYRGRQNLAEILKEEVYEKSNQSPRSGPVSGFDRPGFGEISCPGNPGSSGWMSCLPGRTGPSKSAYHPPGKPA